MSNLSRRSLVASAAALPALALPAVALASVDPVYAAIEAKIATEETWNRAYNRLDEAEHAAEERRPYPLITWGNYMIGGYEIDQRHERLLAERGANRKKIEREYKEAKEEERNRIDAGKRWDERHGLAELRAEESRLRDASVAALDRLAKTCPTTIAGASALLDHVLVDMEGGEHDWQVAALKNIAETLRGQA